MGLGGLRVLGFAFWVAAYTKSAVLKTKLQTIGTALYAFLANEHAEILRTAEGIFPKHEADTLNLCPVLGGSGGLGNRLF